MFASGTNIAVVAIKDCISNDVFKKIASQGASLVIREN